MTGKRVREIGPKRSYRQLPTLPIGVAHSIKDASVAAEQIVDLAKRIGPLLVLVDIKGNVFPLPRYSDRAKAYAKEKPFWIVGVFNREALVRDVTEAIVFAFKDVNGGAQ